MFLAAAMAAASAAAIMLAAPEMATAATTPGHLGYAAEATSYQNTTLGAALATAPGGVRISPNTVEWNDGAVLMTVPAASHAPSAAPATLPCDNGYTCVYNAPNLGGTRLQFRDAGYYQNLDQYVRGWQTRSWRNRYPDRAWLNQYKTSDHGASLCIQGYTLGYNYTGPAKADQWILLTNNNAPC
jgi:Peptidase inhibitor family I36